MVRLTAMGSSSLGRRVLVVLALSSSLWPFARGSNDCGNCGPKNSTERLLLWDSGSRQRGLSDRESNFAIQAVVAEALCGVLVPGPPWELLNAAHSVGRNVSKATVWSDYLQVRSDRAVLVDSNDLGRGAGDDYATWAADYARSRGLAVITGDFDDGFAEASRTAGFVWWLPSGGLTSPGSNAMLAAGRVSGCSVTVTPSETAQSVALEFLRSFGVEAGAFSTLHIRRGDVRGAFDLCKTERECALMARENGMTESEFRRQHPPSDCDTSPPAVATYVECSLKGRTTTLFVFTDELDPLYLRELQVRLSRVVQRVVIADAPLALLIDQVATSKKVPADNYFIYDAGLAVQALAATKLNMDPVPSHHATCVCDEEQDDDSSKKDTMAKGFIWFGVFVVLAMAVLLLHLERPTFRTIVTVLSRSSTDDDKQPLLASSSSKGASSRVVATIKKSTAEASLVLVCVVLLTVLTFCNAAIVKMAPEATALLMVAQMASAATVAAGINKARNVPVFGGLTLKRWFTRILPLSCFFAAYLYTSNRVYNYLEVGFIQMLKPLNGLALFIGSFAMGLEQTSRTRSLNLAVIFGAILLATLSQLELDVGSVDLRGLALLLVSIVTATAYQLGLQLFMQQQREGEEVANFDPVTTLAVVAPTTCAILLCEAIVTRQMDVGSALSKIPLHLLVFDLALSAMLDLAKNTIIGKLSAVSYCLVGYTKDITIVALSTVLVHEIIASTQWAAFALLAIGQGVWTARKLAGRLADSLS